MVRKLRSVRAAAASASCAVEPSVRVVPGTKPTSFVTGLTSEPMLPELPLVPATIVMLSAVMIGASI